MRKELELNIIKNNLDKAKHDQIEEIQKTIKFEVENLKQEFQSEMDEKLAHQVA